MEDDDEDEDLFGLGGMFDGDDDGGVEMEVERAPVHHAGTITL